jgi:peptide chain release factor 1
LTRYAERRGFTVEQLGSSPNEAGGYRRSPSGLGEGAYPCSSGVERTIQRCPIRSRGARPHVDGHRRRHARAEEVEVEVDLNDLKIDVYRSTGPNRSVNTIVLQSASRTFQPVSS